MTRHRQSRADAALDAVYAAIPDPGCKGLCARDACTSIGMTPQERDRIRVRHGVTLPLMDAFIISRPDGVCPALDGQDRCTVYPDRPYTCRIWGVVEDMPCPHGCIPEGGHMPAAQGRQGMARVHEIAFPRRTR